MGRYKKVNYIISNIDKALAFEWITEHLIKENFELSFVLLNNGTSELENYLLVKNISVTRIQLAGKKSWPLALFRLFRYFKEHKPDIIHCHLLEASVLGLIAGKLAGIKKRIYTRHHSSLHHVYHKKGVFWDKLCNYLATDIVAITQKVKEILINWENADSAKVIAINHGFDFSRFEKKEDELFMKLRTKYNRDNNYPVIGVISRFTEWKGVQFIIPAFEKLLVVHPKAKMLLFNANGDYKREIEKLLTILPSDSFQTIAFEQNIFQAYRLFDVYVHTPINDHSEAFGQTYVEALASGVPSVFTMSGIASSFIQHEKNALVVPFRDSEAIYLAFLRILNETTLKEKLIREGWKSVKERFALQRMIEQLRDLYERK